MRGSGVFKSQGQTTRGGFNTTRGGVSTTRGGVSTTRGGFNTGLGGIQSSQDSFQSGNSENKGCSNVDRFNDQNNMNSTNGPLRNGLQSEAPFSKTPTSNGDTRFNSKPMDSWEPMSDDYKNNSYRSPQKDNHRHPSIYISGIPGEMDECGLKSLFRENVPGHEPTRCSIKDSRNGLSTNFGFLHYPTIRACEEVVRTMDGFSIGSGRLSISMGKNNTRNDMPGDQRNSGRPTRRDGAWNPDNKTRHFDTSQGGFVAPGQQGPKPEVYKPAEENDEHFCAVCSKKAGSHCAMCSDTFYCSHHCQMQDWPKHRGTCSKQSTESTKIELVDPAKPSCGDVLVDPAKPSWGDVSDSKPVNDHWDIISSSRNNSDIWGNKPAGNSPPEEAKKPAGGTPQPLTMSDLPEAMLPGKCQAFYVEGDSPLNFFVQLTNNKTTIETINQLLERRYEGSPPDPNLFPKDGDVIAAQWDEDWYRAIVLQEGSTTLKVQYIDYGNVGEVARHETRPLTCLTDVMPQAFLCRLGDVLVPHEHTHSTIQFFNDTIMASEASLVLTNLRKHDGEFNVKVQLATGQDLGDVMIGAGHAERVKDSTLTYKSPVLTLNEKYNVNVPYIVGANEIYLSFLSEAHEVLDMASQLRCYTLNTTPGGDIQVGDPVAATYDNIQYRAVIMATLPNNKLKVKFVDFGNIEIVELLHVFKLTAEYMVLPKQAIECTLNLEVSDPESVTNLLKAEFPDSLAVDAKFISKEGDRYVVILKKGNDKEITQQLVTSGQCTLRSVTTPPRSVTTSTPIKSPTASSESAPPLRKQPVLYTPKCTKLPIGDVLTVAISSITSPTLIHVNFMTDDQSAANDVSTVGDGIPTFKDTHTSPITDQLVLCYSEDYSEWYRGVVKCVTKDSCTVYSLDFGYSKAVNLDRMVPAEEKHGKLPPLAFNCSFQGAQQILTKMRDTVQKSDYTAILNELLTSRGEIQAEIISQDGLDVVIKTTFDLAAQLKEKLRPLIRPPSASSSNGVTQPRISSASPVTTTATTVPQGYHLVSTREWEALLLDMDRVKRYLRAQGAQI